jgi:spore photoproduct lyase
LNETVFSPKKIFVERSSLHFSLAQKILKNLDHIPVKIVEDLQELAEETRISRDPISEGKKNLLLAQQKGNFVKSCPCTPRYVGCNYFIINADLHCPMDCSYCILQSYLQNPLITVFVNTQDLWGQLDEFLSSYRNRMIRIGTGELGDSLALDHITERSRDMISYFSEKGNALFELKTKTTNIENILEIDPPDNVVIAWSLNTPKIVLCEEKDSPDVKERINAARMVSEKGYRTAFHFDPIIHYQGFEKDYAEVIDELLSRINPARIAWISLGSLRFPPELKSIIRKRFPQTKMIYDEFIRGKDGKFRYFKPLRIHLYRKISQCIKKKGGHNIPLYLCMETREIWGEGLKKTPGGKVDVEKSLTLPPGVMSDADY